MPATYSQAIGDPEFINVTKVSPKIAKCDIKVLYLGNNRNGTNVTRESALKMSETLRGCPIVGWYDEESQGFQDHGERLIMDNTGIREECMTTPYGFVSPDAKVWFQSFDEDDEMGNIVHREYLMTQGYIWRDIFPHADEIVNDENHLSLEWDPDSMKGNWAIDPNTGLSFFILNDAVFEKLCVLGEGVEPCFEGATFSDPFISNMFSLDKKKNFVNTLTNMYAELKKLNTTLENEGGQNIMPNDKNQATPEPTVEPAAEMAAQQDEEEKKEEEKKKSDEKIDKNALSDNPKNENNVEAQMAKKNDDDEEDDEQDDTTDNDDETEGEEDDEDKKKSKNSLTVEELSAKFDQLSNQYEELSNQYAALKAENESLVDFKNSVELKAKNAKIDEFYMLSEEDKQEIVKNISKYSVNEIEEKLAAICYRKKINFNNEVESEEEEKPVTTYNLGGTPESSSLPIWLQAVENNRKEN